MQFTNTLAVAASLVAAVSGAALPQPVTSCPGGGTTPGLPADAKFQLLALGLPGDVFPIFQAALGSIFLELPNQNATCDNTDDDNFATFYLNQTDGGLYLYGPAAAPQQMFTDRSGMGQGKLGYISGDVHAPRNAEVTGWQVDQYGVLTLKGASFLACPHSIEDSWSVSVATGVDPVGKSGCVGIVVGTLQIDELDSCSYTPSP
ncbi:cell wall protein PhiA [Colletotrichum orchidophilum]|uniref:Cell wall protein PhiA n=1 Tax=Colletotrichum orchidophilum TaxID=1209926 RepID=A0A1G4BK33_9PEZI|nr:cell wall protein PhiA [Colletotrichum orchidophilum]OHF01673.1 cell wall protein PhiA [Colletotrichum orchidophilum]